MRTYGRALLADGSYGPWVVVETDARGFNDQVYLTTLCQNLKLVLGESPFYANNGIPSKTAVLQQVAPDAYVMQLQQQFSQYFASLIIVRQDAPVPTYKINIMTHQGVRLDATVPVPQ